jgi:hypothetical protein
VNRPRRPAAAYLLHAVRRSLGLDSWLPADAVDAVDVERLRAAAEHHRVQPFVRAVARQDPRGARLVEAVEEGYWIGVTTHLRALADLKVAAAALEGAAVSWAVFKGPVLAELVYPRPELRLYTDVDLLVDPAQLRDAIEALEAAGCRLLDQNWDMLRDRMLGEVHLKAPAGTTIDLHWHMVNRPENRRRVSLRTEELLSRRRVVTLHRMHAPVLDWADAFVHLAVHASLSGGDRLLWLVDLALALEHVEDLDALAARARKSGTTRHLALMLSRVRVISDSGRVGAALSRVAPHAVERTILAVADAVSPVSEVTGTHSLARFLALTTESTVPGTMRSVGQGLTARARARGRGVDLSPLTSPDNPDSVLYASGGAAAREDFLRRVARARG